jgi:hypothetical protein
VLLGLMTAVWCGVVSAGPTIYQIIVLYAMLTLGGPQHL